MANIMQRMNLGLNNNDYLFWQLLGSLQRECCQTFHSIIGPWMKGSEMRISWHPLSSFLTGLKTTKTRLVIHCDYIACASIVERMHPLSVQVIPFCLHEIRPVSGNEYTGHWLNSPILEICPKVVAHSLVKAKARKPPPLLPHMPKQGFKPEFASVVNEANSPTVPVTVSPFWSCGTFFHGLCNYLAVQTVFNCLLRIWRCAL